MTVPVRPFAALIAALAFVTLGWATAPGSSATPSPAIATVRVSVEQPSWRVRMLGLVNAERAKVGAAPLVLCPALNRAAQKYARSMASTGRFDHTGPDGRDPADRIAAEGYQFRSLGENIAAGQPSVRRVMNGWVHSPGHYANIVSERFTHLGVGHADSKGTRYSEYWVQDFGSGGSC